MPDDLEKIETRVTELVAGRWSVDVERFRRALVAMWSANGERVSLPQVRALLDRLDLRPVDVDPTEVLLPAAVAGDARVPGATAVALGPVAKAVLTGVREKPAAAAAEAMRRAGATDLTTVTGLLGVVAPLSRSAGEMRGAASYAVQTAANEATISAAAQVEAKVVFVAERDACLECNARAGDTGDAVTADPPPVHPNCRCEVQTYEDEEVVRALKREALRSVLRGFSLPSESQAARLRAASAALRGRPNAPESVKRYAAAAVRKGAFPRGRRFPGSS